MKVKKLISTIKDYLGIPDFEEKGKKKSLKILLKKLRAKEEKIAQSLQKGPENELLKEELEILTIHIKKAKKMLEKLETRKT